MSIYCGREFGPDDIQTINRLMEHNPRLQRAPMSRQLCELWGWKKPNGQLKDMTCRVALLRMQADGLITLPPSRMTGGARSKPHFPPTPATDPPQPLLQPVHELAVLDLRPVMDTAVSRLWNEYIARYHYLGYSSMSGAQMRYNVFVGERLVALLSFGASAWKLAGRDSYIGWQQDQRLKNLQLVVNNARFLILPWIQSRAWPPRSCPASRVNGPATGISDTATAPSCSRPSWRRSATGGTCYKAANWVHVGQTTGRGKKSRVHHQIIPIKDIWLYPLRKDFASVLRA